MDINKILCIQNRQLGDVLMCTPAVHLLRENYPHAEIHFLTEYAGSQVLKHNPALDRVIVVERKPSLSKKVQLFNKIRKEKYDVVIDFFNNPTSALITFFSFAPVRCGFSSGTRQWTYNRVLRYSDAFTYEYAASTKSRLLTLLGLEIDPLPPIEMTSTDIESAYAAAYWKSAGVNSSGVVIAMCPVSRRNYKIWGAEKFAYIADQLITQKNAKIWLVYGPGEFDQVNEVYEQVKNKKSVILTEEIPDILQKHAVFKRCLLYLGVDGGNKHIAITSGIQTITVFRQIYPENWTPPKNKKHIAFAEGNPGQPPLNSIKKEDVLHKTLDMIDHFEKGGSNE